jgi:hypothetical protein
MFPFQSGNQVAIQYWSGFQIVEAFYSRIISATQSTVVQTTLPIIEML